MEDLSLRDLSFDAAVAGTIAVMYNTTDKLALSKAMSSNGAWECVVSSNLVGVVPGFAFFRRGDDGLSVFQGLLSGWQVAAYYSGAQLNHPAPFPNEGQFKSLVGVCDVLTPHLLALQAKYGITRVHFVGHSFGGVVAANMAVRSLKAFRAADVQCTTFGTPSPGNARYIRMLRDIDFRAYANQHDGIALFPSPLIADLSGILRGFNFQSVDEKDKAVVITPVWLLEQGRRCRSVESVDPQSLSLEQLSGFLSGSVNELGVAHRISTYYGNLVEQLGIRKRELVQLAEEEAVAIEVERERSKNRVTSLGGQNNMPVHIWSFGYPKRVKVGPQQYACMWRGNVVATSTRRAHINAFIRNLKTVLRSQLSDVKFDTDLLSIAWGNWMGDAKVESDHYRPLLKPI